MTLAIRALKWQIKHLKKRKEDLQIKFAQQGHRHPEAEQKLITKFENRIQITESLLAKEEMKGP